MQQLQIASLVLVCYRVTVSLRLALSVAGNTTNLHMH